ncbi:MAG: flagellar basal body rod C-terminal domain-containing protein, partial [Armatimonadota bacterium]|nr:flagellar basal body rod C-terminal domain-containing protein [Armatimonadota bacterium]
ADVQALQERLDTLARNLVQLVNDLHHDGYDLDGNPGGPFFEGTDARTVRVAGAILGDPRRIAAAGSWTGDGEPGNGEVALRIAQLRGAEQVDGAYRSLVAELGVRAQEASRQVAYQDLLRDQVRLRREATSGVSLDEEMTDMIRFQHAYEAAARTVRTVDDMLRTLLDMVGR